MNKILSIGIDSLDPELLLKYEVDLPNFTKIRKQSPVIHSSSVFPVDSIPAWVSIYTGLNPAKHGIIHSFDIFGSSWKDIVGIDVNVFKGSTFWDRASDSDKKVCILFPFLADPPWEVNGLMVGRSTDEFHIPDEVTWMIRKDITTCPAKARAEYGIPDSIKGVKGRPPSKKDLDKYVEVLKTNTIEEGNLALRLSKEADWDLFFMMFSWLDIVQHFFWRFCDEEDPTYPGENPYQNVIKEFYQRYDNILGEFMEAHPETTTIVFSDHGHAMRPVRTVNINEVLRKKGLLKSRSGRISPAPFILENLKRISLDLIRKFELDHLMVRVSKSKALSSISKDIYMSSASIDLDRSMAYLSSFAGPKSYSHGGIEVNKGNLKGESYEELRTMLIDELSGLIEPETDQKLVKWVCRREDLYQGQNIHLYPDIVFELAEGYGVYWGIHTPLIGTAYEHKLASGGHHRDAVFLIANCTEQPKRDSISVMDIGPTILQLLGIKPEEEIDGKSIF